VEIFKKSRKSQLFQLKNSKIFKNPKFYLKDFLVFLGGIKEEDDIDLVINAWNKSLINWIISVSFTGLLINVILTLLLNLRFNFYSWFAWGLFAYLITKIWGGYVNGKRKIARAG